MKKQYRIITLVINLLLLVLFVVVEGMYTYETATKIMNEKWQEVNEYAGWSITKRSIDSDINITHYLYSDFEDSALFKSDDVGYYELFIRDDGKKFESCNFIEVTCSRRTEYIPPGSDSKHKEYDISIITEETRYIPVGSDSKLNNKERLHSLKIDALCDDYFIFNGTIKCHDIDHDDHKYTLGENELASAENAVPVSEWLGDDSDDIDGTYFAITNSEYEEKICDEAKEKLEEVIDKIEKGYVIKTNNNGSISYSENSDINERIENGETVSYSQKELGTSFYISNRAINSDTDNAYVIYLFHPLELAFRNNIEKYITSLIVFILLEIFVVIVMRKMNRKRMK